MLICLTSLPPLCAPAPSHDGCEDGIIRREQLAFVAALQLALQDRWWAVPLRSPAEAGRPPNRARVPQPADARSERAEDVLDRSVLVVLQEMEQQSGLGLLAQLIGLYLRETPAAVAALQEAVAHGDAARVEREDHGLPGSAAQLGATRMSRLCRALQQAGARGDLSGAGAQGTELRREFVRVRVALEGVLRSAGGRARASVCVAI